VGGSEEFRFKKENKFLHKKAHHEREWNWGQDISKGEELKRCITLLRPLPTSLVFCLMITYSRIFAKYPKGIPFVSLIKIF
jgi:hypothetical protein